MTFSIDTCVLLDMLLPDPDFGERSKEILNRANKKGPLIICPIVYAELCPQFEKQTDLDTFLRETGIKMQPFNREMLWMAGEVWNDYRSRGGIRKDRILPDFLIGAFTSIKAESIVTRDKNFYEKNFSLQVYY